MAGGTDLLKVYFAISVAVMFLNHAVYVSCVALESLLGSCIGQVLFCDQAIFVLVKCGKALLEDVVTPIVKHRTSKSATHVTVSCKSS